MNNGGNGMTPSAVVTDKIGSIDLILKDKSWKLLHTSTLKYLQASHAITFSYDSFALKTLKVQQNYIAHSPTIYFVPLPPSVL